MNGAHSHFACSSTVLIDFSTRVTWSATRTRPAAPCLARPGLLATLNQSCEDFSFSFRPSAPVLQRFLAPELALATQARRPSEPRRQPTVPSSTQVEPAKRRTQTCASAPKSTKAVASDATVEKPFICPYALCQKRFARKEELTRHRRIHTGQRPYNCSICEKSFGRKDHLNKHLIVHLHRSVEPRLQRAVCRLFANMSQRRSSMPRLSETI